MRIHPSLLAILPAAVLTACNGPPGPRTPGPQIAALHRSSYTVPGADYRLSYLVGGPAGGPRIVLIHGTPGDATGWADFITQPPSGFSAIAIDRPGFGQSGPDEAVPSLSAQAAAIAPLLETRDGRRPILVGHSLGGPLAVRIALDNPGRVGGLVIVAGALDPGQEKIHWAQPIGAGWFGRLLLPRALRNANTELMALKPQLVAMQADLGRLGCPVIIVHGTRDDLVPYANVGFMSARMTGAQLAVDKIADANHFIPWEHPDRIRRAIDRVAAAEGPPC